jgi:two-component system response regulator RegA
VIVEDDPAFGRTLRRSFERRGYEVLLATSPEELALLMQSTRSIMRWWT